MSTDPTIETIAVQDDSHNISHMIITTLVFVGVYSLGKAVGTIKERNRQYRYAQSQKES